MLEHILCLLYYLYHLTECLPTTYLAINYILYFFLVDDANSYNQLR